MRNNYFLILFLLYSTNLIYINTCNSKQVIVWKSGKKLKWSDFQSPISYKYGVNAESTIRIKLDYEVGDSILKYKIFCLFYKLESYARNKSDYVLNHEQGHFDIGEIYTRMLRAEIDENRKVINRKNYTKIDSLYKRNSKEMMEEQILYDYETKHGNDSVAQKSWDSKIFEKLQGLNKFEY